MIKCVSSQQPTNADEVISQLISFFNLTFPPRSSATTWVNLAFKALFIQGQRLKKEYKFFKSELIISLLFNNNNI